MCICNEAESDAEAESVATQRWVISKLVLWGLSEVRTMLPNYVTNADLVELITVTSQKPIDFFVIKPLHQFERMFL